MTRYLALAGLCLAAALPATASTGHDPAPAEAHGAAATAPAADHHETPAASPAHDEPVPAHEPAHAAPAAAHAAPHWTYEGEAGPDHWGAMSADFAACAAGHFQSPIDVAQVSAHEPRSLAAAYHDVPLTVLHNGHTVQFNAEGAGEVILNGVAFKLLQVHFHSPSEHVVAGRHAPLEAHLVHRSAGGALAVLGVMIEPGAENAALTALAAHLPEHESPAAEYADTAINPGDLLPADRGFTWYYGSLTTPPCSEGVNWHVLNASITASPEQIAKLSHAMGANARPVQDTHGRLVVAQ
jgi:carbonic anhydrase